MTKMQESDAHLQRLHGAPLCGAFSFAVSAVGGNKRGGGGIAARGKEKFHRFAVCRGRIGVFVRFCPFSACFAAKHVAEGAVRWKKLVKTGKSALFGLFSRL